MTKKYIAITLILEEMNLMIKKFEMIIIKSY